MSERLSIGNPKRVEKGQGTRRLQCDRYKECLDYAAKNRWDGFDCGSCSYPERQAVDSKPEKEKGPALLCADCGEKERMGNSPYCPSCMAIRGNKARVKNRVPKKPKKRKDTKAKPTPAKALEVATTALTIEFGKHAAILREVESLADREIRPVECQVIYMLKAQLSNIGKENVLAVRKHLWERRLGVTKSDIGGNFPRTVTFYLSDGKIRISHHKKEWYI